MISQDYNGTNAISSARAGDEERRPELWAKLVLAEARDNLAILHNEFLPEYVVSSSWTLYLKQEQMASIFQRTGLTFVADNLHEDWATKKFHQWQRAEEIENWISMYYLGQPLLVLDDLESGWSLQKSDLYKRGHTVLCDAWVGFVSDKLVEAQKKLRAQLTIRKDHG